MKRKQMYFIVLLYTLTMLIFTFILMQSLSPKASITVNAASNNATYAKILDNCYFYEKQESSSGMFILPESYYVKILSKGSIFHRVSYLDEDDFATAVQGYVLATSVHIIENYIPQNPYLQYKVSVTFKINILKTNRVNDTYDSPLDEIQIELPFYGISKVNTKVYNCVNYKNKIAAVDSKACSIINYPKHPDSLLQNINNSGIGSGKNEQSNFLPLIVTSVIVILCLLGLGISYFIFNGTKKHKLIQVFDEIDES